MEGGGGGVPYRKAKLNPMPELEPTHDPKPTPTRLRVRLSLHLSLIHPLPLLAYTSA